VRGVHMASDQAVMSETAATILRLMAGSQIAQVIRTAAELGLADHLDDQPRDAESLAEVTSTHAHSLARLLRVLATVGLVHETADRCYRLTPLGAALRTNVSGSMRASVRFLSDEMHERPWQALADAIRTGEVAFDQVFGTDQFTYLSTHPESANLFDQAMRGMTQGVNATLIASYPFGNFGWIVDVGGGTGSLLIPILERNPTMRGTILELAHVARQARERIAAVGLGSRCDAVEGDALAGIPHGANAYVFKSVIHMHGDDNAITILRNCRSGMPPSGKVILIERLLPEQIGPSDHGAQANLLLDLSMLVLNGGCERTEKEYESLLARAGLRLNSTIATQGPQSIIEAVPT
jgi:orsellinic acid C2-O-methyltransferase